MTNATSLLARARRTATGGGSARVVLAVLAAATSLALTAVPAGAEIAHPGITGEYGKEGPAASGLGGGCYLAYDSSEARLYLMAEGKIFALHHDGVGSVSPVGGNFPISVTGASYCGDSAIAVDEGTGNIFEDSSGETVRGYDSTGVSLPNFPLNTNGGGENCGIATTGSGEVWTGNYTQQAVLKYSGTGGQLGSIPIGSVYFCKIAVDRGNGDVYIIPYGSGQIEQRTAASGYSESPHTYEAFTGQLQIAVDGAHHRVYVPQYDHIKAYDTTTGDLIEEIPTGTFGDAQAAAVDEATGTLFVADTNNGVIKEFAPITIPKSTTGPATGNTTISGTADPDGAGPITECYFEYGLEKGNYTLEEPCEQTLPITSQTQVTASLPGLTTETTYHYRLVLDTAAPGTRSNGVDRTFVPHAVEGVITKPPTELTYHSAILHGEYKGSGPDVHYFFEYGLDDQYGNSTPVVDGGTAAGPQAISMAVDGLEAYRTYHYRLVAYTSATQSGTTYGEDLTFDAGPAPLPEVRATSVNSTSDTTATVEAEINPNFGATLYRFEYGTSSDYGEWTEFIGPIGGDGTFHSVSGSVTELLPGTLYHFRAVAVNFTGPTYGADQTLFTPTAPVIDLSSASGVGQTTAQLSASTNPNAAPTTVHFEYGPTASYGTSTPGVEIGAGTADRSASAALSGLAAGTTYHFRAVAVNAYGTTTGLDRTFTTSPAPGPEPPAPVKCKKGFVKRHGVCKRKRPKHHKRHRHSTRKHG